MTAAQRPAPFIDEANLVAKLRQGIADADADRADAAERAFRDVLTEVRGTGTNVERFACSCLAKVFARRHRGIETLALARRHLVLAVARRDAEATCLAYAGLGDAFARLRDWRRLDATIADFEESLRVYRGRFATPLARCLLRLRAERLLADGDADAAALVIRRIAMIDPSAPEGPEEARATLLFEADVALRQGRPHVARAALVHVGADADAAPGGEDALDAEFLDMRCTLAIDGPDAAAGAIRRMLDHLESPAAERHGAGSIKRFARLLGDLAASECGAQVLAKRAYDVAAAAVLVRAAEIERAVRDLPELASLDADDAAALAEYRARYAAEQRDLLAAVGRLLRARIAAGEIPSWAQRSPAGVVDVCAWCLQVRLPDGATLPLGHYLPHDAGLRVSHGICRPCTARLTASRLRPATLPF